MAANKTNWYKWSIVIAALVVYGLLMRSCGIKSVTKTEGSDTTITIYKTDTVYKIEPEFVAVTNTIHVPKIIYRTDTFETFERIFDLTDTAALLRDYNATVFYRDTQQVASGRIIISDSVRQNRIKSRRLQTELRDTLIEKITVLHPPRRFVGSVLFSVAGNNQHPLSGTGAGFALKTPDDVSIGIMGKIWRQNRPTVELQLGLPLRLKKKP